MTEVQFAKQFLTTLDSKTTKYQSDYAFDPKTFQTRIPYTLPKLSHPPHPLPPKNIPPSTPAPGSEPAGQTQESTTTATIDLCLKSSRNPNFTLNLPKLPLSTPISTLKSVIQNLLPGAIATEKIKILYNKKPVPPSKSTVQDVISNSSSDTASPSTVEFGVMVMGGAADPVPLEQTINLNNETDAAGPGSENAAAEAITGVNPETSSKSAVGAGDVDMQGTSATESKLSDVVQPGEQSGHDLLSRKDFWDDLQGFLEQRLKDTDEAVRLRGLFEKVAR